MKRKNENKLKTRSNTQTKAYMGCFERPISSEQFEIAIEMPGIKILVRDSKKLR